MSFVKSHSKKPRKFQILLVLLGLTVLLIILTLLLLNNGLQDVIRQHLLFDAQHLLRVGSSYQIKNRGGYQWSSLTNSSHRNYSNHQLMLLGLGTRTAAPITPSETVSTAPEVKLPITTTAVHIFYMAPVPWYKASKSQVKTHQDAAPSARPQGIGPEVISEQLVSINNRKSDLEVTKTMPNIPHPRPPKILNSAFYPALGLYKSTPTLLQQHFASIQRCGIGVIILSCCSSRISDQNIQKMILELAPAFNLSVTFEVSVAGNQTLAYLEQQLLHLNEYRQLPGFYRVYSQSQESLRPLIYISNAYKLFETLPPRAFCSRTSAKRSSSLRSIMDALFIAHIRLKNQADFARRLCFDGIYSKLASNGATFASTWKNWSYLKSFAHTYKMLFIPTVGPGFAERHKFPRHGDIQRHRSNGRYYGVAWRTAILNHVGFINIASYNNWPDGSQIEEVVPRAGFLDYNPGPRNKYLELTAHWVGNFVKNRQETALSAKGFNAPTSFTSCYELLNNTIC